MSFNTTLHTPCTAPLVHWLDNIDDHAQYSDLYKDTYGFRPSNVHFDTQHDYDETVDRLLEVYEERHTV